MTENEKIVEAAKNLVRCLRNNNSPAMATFDVKSVTYPFSELEKLLFPTHSSKDKDIRQ